jgi:hypothetical protein
MLDVWSSLSKVTFCPKHVQYSLADSNCSNSSDVVTRSMLMHKTGKYNTKKKTNCDETKESNKDKTWTTFTYYGPKIRKNNQPVHAC